MDAPQIIAAKANDTVLSTEETVTLDTNDITFAVDFTDPQGDNYSGIDETATQIFLDGTVLTSDKFTAAADRAQTAALKLSNGEHTLEISICDNFGNRTEQVYNFTVDNPDTDIPVVSIERSDNAELGGDYEVVIKADSLADIVSINTSIVYENTGKLDTEQKYLSNSSFYDDYGNALTQGEDGNYYDADGNLVAEPMRPSAAGNYTISSAVQVLGENLTGTVRNKAATSTTRAFTASATVNESVSADTTLLTFTLPIPSTLAAVDKVPVTITVSYTTTDGSTYTVTSGRIINSVYAYYTLVPGTQISGAEGGTITVKTNDGSEVNTENLILYNGTEELTGTFVNNVFTTNYFTALDAGTTSTQLWVGDAVNKHYSFYTQISVSESAEGEYPAYAVTLNATTGNPTVMQQVTWMRGATTIPQKAGVQYMTKSAYDAAYAEAESALPEAVEGEEAPAVDMDALFADAATAEGSFSLTDFGLDKVAAYINSVNITDLTAGTQYVLRAGDGDGWSEVVEFNTLSPESATSFVVIGDGQLHGDNSTDASAIEDIMGIGSAVSGIDFGIQTGDFVDGGTCYAQWAQILDVFGDAFTGVDFVHTMGNHEVYAGETGTAGTAITNRLYGMGTDSCDYYSVEYGDVYVAVINQSADIEAAANWLIEDAAKTDCTWKVMVTHQPVMYTNPNGSSEGHNKLLAPACDEAGIDFVFGGHDHAYARTEQQKDGIAVDLDTNDDNVYVDADGMITPTQGMGTVYMIVGALHNEKDSYPVVENADFHFAVTDQSFHAMYLTVDATEGKFTVNAWNYQNGASTLVDTYTMYNGKGVCESVDDHSITQDTVEYNPETGCLICDRCGDEVDPAEIMYTGYAIDMNGADTYGDNQYYFLAGRVRTGFFAMGDKFIYANENGLIDHETVNYTTQTCTTSGRYMAYSPRYNETYTGGVAKYTGHNYVENDNGELVCTNTYCQKSDTGYTEYECGHVAIDVADWDFSLSFTSMSYTGTDRRPAVVIKNPETDETLTFAWDGEGALTDYYRTWANNRDVGIATCTVDINPVGDYTNSKGTVVLELKICPLAPTNLEVESTDSTSVTLNWTAFDQATGYKVYRKNGDTWKLVGTTNETSYTVTGLNAETEYEFAVKSITVTDDATLTSLGYSDSVTAVTSSGESISSATVTLQYTTYVYSGGKKTPAVTVTDAEGKMCIRDR